MTNKEKNFISAVVYVNNNENEIKEFLKKLNNTLNNSYDKYEIIIVNDASTDNSVNVIKEYSNSQSTSCISLISMSFYQGLEQSMVAGIDLSIGDFVFEFDNITLDYDINLINEVYKTALKGSDIVRVINSNKKKSVSAVFYKIFNKYSNNQYKIESESFRLLSRRAINRIQQLNKTIPYRKALYSNCGLKMDSVYYKGSKTNSRANFKKNSDIAINSLIIFTNVAYKFSIFLSILFMLFTLVTGVYSMVIFISKSPVEGYTSTILLLSAAFFGIFLILSIIIKYLSIIIDLTFKKHNYIIESIEKLS